MTHFPNAPTSAISLDDVLDLVRGASKGDHRVAVQLRPVTLDIEKRHLNKTHTRKSMLRRTCELFVVLHGRGVIKTQQEGHKEGHKESTGWNYKRKWTAKR